MKALIASLTALSLIVSPAFAAPKTAKATTSTAKAAKAEGESTATEAKEHKMAKRHHHAARCSCPAKSMHKGAKKGSVARKAASKKTSTTTKK
jgi:hypothetical protein